MGLWHFANFCSTYSKGTGTNELSKRISHFIREMEQHGSLALEIPEAKELKNNMYANASNMERLISRIDAGYPETMNQGFESAEAELNSRIEWFTSTRDGMKLTLGPHLVESDLEWAP